MRRTLERLYLDGNGLAELPENLATLRSLRYLTLDGNQLRHVQPATLLPNLIGACRSRGVGARDVE